MKNLQKLISGSVLAIALASGAGVAQADFVVTDNYNGKSFRVIDFSTAGGRVDLQYTGGYYDSVISLFDASGLHIISNDDTYDPGPSAFYSRISQSLTAGHYSLVVSECCGASGFVGLKGASATGNDDYNITGSYYVGGTATLTDLVNELSKFPAQNPTDTFSVSLGNASLYAPNPVPEPATLTLAALGLAGIAAKRRKQA